VAEGRRLTRRDALSGAAAIGAGALLGPVVGARAARGAGFAGAGAQALEGRSAGRVFMRRVGALGAGEARTVTLSRTVCLAAVRWSAPADARVTVRTRRADGRWGSWAVASCAGHDGDGVTTHDRVGEGVWVGRATELQIRSRGPVEGVSLQLVAADPGARQSTIGTRAAAADSAANALPLAGPTLQAGPGQPPIIARRVWAGNDHPPVAGPYYGSIEMGIVHHTENPNGYSAAEVPAMLRAIYEFHVHGRGWFDIGYNFVVDRFGRIWEARQGGIDLPVMGAQAGDWNQISFGVSMLGTYTDVLPSAAALTAVERLLAWKLALNGLPAIGEINEVAGPEGISWTQFRVGQHVRLPRIAGHRQVDSTDCPGDALFGHLTVMRSQVNALIGTEALLVLTGEITLFADGPVVFLSGVLAEPEGTPMAGAPVEIQSVVGHAGATRTLATVTSADDGSFQTSVPARAGLLLRAVRTTAPAAVSGLLGVESLRSATAGGADALRLAGPPRL
jgi:hypothetical protein